MEIITVSSADLDNVVEIYQKVIKKMQQHAIFQWDDSYPSRALLQEDITKKQLYAGILHGDIVSLFVLNHESDPDYINGAWNYTEDNYCVLHRLCVRCEFQGHRIGIKTIQTIEHYLKNRGVESLRFDTFSQNFIALRLYTALNYTVVGSMQWPRGIFYLYEKLL
ncbi:MAG: GNAT family N-acetyltransferase [Treponema sp.]|nr:GNAT family N-acetyltransferase [Treponema sp.]